MQKISEKIQVDNYHNEKPAYFNIYENCIISSQLKKNLIWEKHLHNVFIEFITTNSIVIEGGCHIGSHTIILGMLAKHVYAFEPLKSSYNLLDQNIKNNELKNITLFEKGLSNTFGRTYFEWTIKGNPGGSGLSNNPMGKPSWSNEETDKYEIELITIDSLNLDKLDFIKLDIEGYEKLAILGGIETIKKFKPVITLEVWCNHYGGIDMNFTKKNFKDLIDIGYNVINIGGPDFLFIPK